jgi:hypothetical protein
MPVSREQTEIAEGRFQAALAERGATDPRDIYRTWLRELKHADPGAYRTAVQYYEETLIPTVADAGSDPLEEWIEYGRVVLAMAVAGTTVAIDETGLSRPYQRPVSIENLVLHLPHSSREPIIAISVPPVPSAAQSAAYDLLVLRKVG